MGKDEATRRQGRGGSYEARTDGRKGGAGHASAFPFGRIAAGKNNEA